MYAVIFLPLRLVYAYTGGMEKAEPIGPERRAKEAVVAIVIFNGLGMALRWLRDRRGRKQYEVADAAGITKGMLSAYETERQRPSIDTLEKILSTLGCDLSHLHSALRVVNGEPAASVPPEPERSERPRLQGFGAAEIPSGDTAQELYRLLDLPYRLPAEPEQALLEMMAGFHRFLRYLCQDLPRTP